MTSPTFSVHHCENSMLTWSGRTPKSGQAFSGVTGRDPTTRMLSRIGSGRRLSAASVPTLRSLTPALEIDEDTAAKMWDPFFSKGTTGRGLGLAVVQGVVRSHGGRIRVQSRLGAGTAVKIIFSAAHAERPGVGGRLVRRAEGAGADSVMAHPG